MARGKTLESMLIDLRAACGMSRNAAHNAQVRDEQVIALQKKQEWYWGDFAWPHLRVERFLQVQAGQRYYDMPADLDIDRIGKIEVRMDRTWLPVMPGIDARHYAAVDSDLDERDWPVQRWQITENEMLELWPVSSVNFDPVSLDGQLKITGIRTLKPLVAESDRADLDDQLLVKSCAADYLAAAGSKDAQLRLDEANRLYVKLRGRLMPRRVFSIGQTEESKGCRPTRYPIAVYNKTT